MEELQSIYADTTTKKIGGTDIVFNIIKVKDVPKAIGIVEKCMDLVNMSGESNINFLKTISKEWDSVSILIEICTNLTKENIENLNIGAAAQIVTEVVKQNRDFLAQHVLPILKPLLEKKNQKDGLTKSKG